jgi:hypothetical protein
MEQLAIIVIIVVLAAGAFVTFGMAMGKRARYDFDLLEGFVDRCAENYDNEYICLEELNRLKDGGLIPTEDIDRLTRKIVKKFR